MSYLHGYCKVYGNSLLLDVLLWIVGPQFVVFLGVSHERKYNVADERLRVRFDDFVWKIDQIS